MQITDEGDGYYVLEIGPNRFTLVHDDVDNSLRISQEAPMGNISIIPQSGNVIKIPLKARNEH